MSKLSTCHIFIGHVCDVIRSMPDASVDCVVTSPPYWGLRDYGVEGQIGLEDTPEQYIQKMVTVFREVRRVLKKSGTLWLNLGDSYSGSWSGKSMRPNGGKQRDGKPGFQPIDGRYFDRNGVVPKGLKPKDLCGIPWRVALALQADGWWLRQDIIWHKPNPMPESVRDRCTKAHEYIFLMTNSAKYFWNMDAVKEPDSGQNGSAANFKRESKENKIPGQSRKQHRLERAATQSTGTRNIRSVWTIPTQAVKEVHFATFPEKLVETCLLAGCPVGGVVLDPFCGSGTVGVVALRQDKSFIGIELNPEYCKMAENRIRRDNPLFNQIRIDGSTKQNMPTIEDGREKLK